MDYVCLSIQMSSLAVV